MAYTPEYAAPTRRRIQFSGQAAIEATDDALFVEPQAGRGYAFVLSQFHERVPVGAVVSLRLEADNPQRSGWVL
jgi:hypothetical protein